jgi:hypothetical protein
MTQHLGIKGANSNSRNLSKDAIILNWNSWKNTFESLESIYKKIDYPNMKLFSWTTVQKMSLLQDTERWDREDNEPKTITAYW